MQDFPSESDPDPFTLPEIHEHMIRSPPPTSWPRSPNYKAFRFPGSDDDSSQVSHYLFLSEPHGLIWWLKRIKALLKNTFNWLCLCHFCHLFHILQDHVSAKKSPSRVASPRQSRGALVLEEMARELLRSPASQGGILLLIVLSIHFSIRFQFCS